MRFGLVHRLMTDALAVLGVLALVVSGQFSRTLDVVLLAALGIAIAMKEPWRQRASQRHLDAVATVALITTQLARAFLTSASVLDLLIEFAVGLQVIRVATRNGAAQDQQVIVLALLHLIAGTVVGGGLGYGLCFVGLLIVTPGALVLSHLRREVEGNYRQGARDRTGLPVDVPRILRSKRVVGRPFIVMTCLLSLPILVFTAILFVVFPRVGLSLLLLNKPRGDRMIGFSGTVNLGQIGTLRSDPTIALRVAVPDLPSPPPLRKMMYLRGTALDQYDGRTWTQSQKSVRPLANAGEVVPISGVPGSGETPWHIELEPFEPPVLFITPTTKAVELARSGNITPGFSVQLMTGPEGEFRYQAPSDRAVRYSVYPSEAGTPNFTRLKPTERPRYLQLPPQLPARIGELARAFAGSATTDIEKARVVEQRLRGDFAYDLASPSGKAEQPLDDFLFDSKRGHCEYFSTAMAVMLRSLEIPSRNVTGFVGGSYNKYGNFYAVRQGDAHSWVEAYIEGRGWLTFDPTPPGSAEPQSDVDGALAGVRDFFEAVSQRWNQNVLGYDLTQQIGLFESLNAGDSVALRALRAPKWRIAAALAGLALVGFGVWWRKRGRRDRGGNRPNERTQDKDAQIAARVYRQLDRAMTSAGIPRAESTPPFGHAIALSEQGHPLSSEVMALTDRYLAARFGERPFRPDELRDFERRARWLQQAPHAQRSSRPGRAPERAPNPEEERTNEARSSRRPSKPDARVVTSTSVNDERTAVVADDDIPPSAAAPAVAPIVNSNDSPPPKKE
jgi:transglutaminase-like putative cysteine protease